MINLSSYVFNVCYVSISVQIVYADENGFSKRVRLRITVTAALPDPRACFERGLHEVYYRSMRFFVEVVSVKCNDTFQMSGNDATSFL